MLSLIKHGAEECTLAWGSFDIVIELGQGVTEPRGIFSACCMLPIPNRAIISSPTPPRPRSIDRYRATACPKHLLHGTPVRSKRLHKGTEFCASCFLLLLFLCCIPVPKWAPLHANFEFLISHFTNILHAVWCMYSGHYYLLFSCGKAEQLQ